MSRDGLDELPWRVVEGGGFKLFTRDPILIAVVRRCAELQRQLAEARHQEVARYRTLRRDVRQIKAAVLRPKAAP